MMDLNPIVTPNDVLTGCLNGTLITFNGNENVLLNDMGNGRVETAFLPLGFIPLGTTSFGGIIYIASYNPLTGLSLIGSFPSPERNILSTEEGNGAIYSINTESFYESAEYINKPRITLLLDKKILKLGDKFLIYTSDLDKADIKTILSACGLGNTKLNKLPKQLKFNIVSISNNGDILYLDDGIVWYPITNNDLDLYFIKLTKLVDNKLDKPDLDEYRNIVSSNYSVYNSKNSGYLALIAELECVDSFSVTYNADVTDKGEGNKLAIFNFNVNWTYGNLEDRSSINLYGVGIKYKVGDIDKGFVSYLIDYKEVSKNILGSCVDLSNKNFPLNKSFSLDNYLLNSQVEAGQLCAITNSLTCLYLRNKNLLRRNDGTDPDYILNSNIEINYTYGKNIKALFNIYPAMKFGYLSYLRKDISVDLDDLGSGKIKLIEYKYYVENSNITINWGLECYPESRKSIESVEFYYREIDGECSKAFPYMKDEIDNEKYLGGKLEGVGFDSLKLYKSKPSFSGFFSFIEYYGNKLLKNKCYLIQILIKYGEEYRYFYRILYTIPIFNSEYYNTEDFRDLKLNYSPNLIKDSGNVAIILKEDTKYYSKDGKEISIPGLYSTELSSLKGAYLKNVLDIDFDTNYRLVSEEPFKDKFNYGNVFNNFVINEEELNNINVKISLLNNASKLSTDNPEDLDLIEMSSKLNSLANIKVLGGDTLNISGGTYTLEYKTPFNATYSEMLDVKADYNLLKILTTSSRFLVDMAKRGLHLLNLGSSIIDVANSTVFDMDINSSYELSECIKRNFLEYDAIEIEFYITRAKRGSYIYVLRTKGGNNLTYKDGKSPSKSNNLEDARSNEFSEGDVPLKGYLFRGSGSSCYLVITSFLLAGHKVSLNSPINLKDVLDLLYKWVETNEYVKLSKFNNLVYYNNYITNINIDFEIPSLSLKQYNIGELVIDTTVENIPLNLQLGLIDNIPLKIVGSYKISTENLRSQYLKELGRIFWNGITKNISYNEDIKYPVIIQDDIAKECSNIVLNNSGLEYRVSLDNSLLKVDKIINKKYNNTADIYWIAEFTKFKDTKWVSLESTTGLLLKMSGALLLNKTYG